MTNKGSLIILSAPSGGGKDTIIEELLKKDPNIKMSVSATTRTKRESEVDGKNYFFVSTKDFEKMIKSDELIEYAKYCENYYGTPKKAIELWRNQGFNVILKIEVQGAKQVLKKCKDATGIFILPPSMEVLKKRLVNRGTETKETLELRLKQAEIEIKCAQFYDYAVINDNLNDCVNDVLSIIKSEKFKILNMKNIINEVLSQCINHQ